MANILVTRAEPAASRTGLALSKHGYTAVKCPIFEVHDTGEPVPERNYEGLIFTSRNAVDTLHERGWDTTNLGLPVFCVGENTANAAASLGYQDIRTGSGNAKGLAKLIGSSALPPSSRLLYPAARDRKFDFELALKPYDLSVETVEIYVVLRLSPSKKELEQAFEHTTGGVVLVYSARSGEYLSHLIEEYGLSALVSSLTCVTLSKEAAAPINAHHWREIFIAPTPDEPAMIQLLADKF